MNLVTLASQVSITFKIVVVMIVINICWALLFMIITKKLRVLEDMAGVGSKIKTKGKSTKS